MNQIIQIISAALITFILILSLNGCANTVKTQTVQQRYLVVSATMAGNVDMTFNNPVRYFVFIKYNASTTAGPDLLSPNQKGHILSVPNASISIDGVTNTSVNGGRVTTAFDFDELYEYSYNLSNSWNTFANANLPSAYNPALIVTTGPANRIQFAIPLSNTASIIGINFVTTTSTTAIVPSGVTLYNYAILDYLDNENYHLFNNTIGNTYTNSSISNPTINPLTLLPIASSADIISWSASII